MKFARRCVLLLAVALPLAATSAPAAPLGCGQPKTTGPKPTTADALSILRAAVGSPSPCSEHPCICDVNSDTFIRTSDALRVLRVAVGTNLPLTCTCETTTTTSTSTSSTITSSTIPTTTSTSSTTTTTEMPALTCTVFFRLNDAGTFGALQWDTDYSDAPGSLLGSADEAECASLVSGGSVVFNDKDAQQVLTTSLVSPAGFVGPVTVAQCTFTMSVTAVPSDFAISVKDSAPAESGAGMSILRGVDPGSTTTTTLVGSSGTSNVCGSPVTGSSPPFARDALAILRTSIGLSAACALCECDLNDDDKITTSDGFLALRASTGLATTLGCQACSDAPVISGATGSASVTISTIVCQ